MKEKNLIIICITAIICIAILSVAVVFVNQQNTENTTNNSVNISLNDTENNTNNTTATTTKSSTKNNKKSSSKSEYGDYIDDEWVSMSEEE